MIYISNGIPKTACGKSLYLSMAMNIIPSFLVTVKLEDGGLGTILIDIKKI